MTHTIWIPSWRPTPLNAIRGRHWSAEAKAKKEALEFLSVYGREVPRAEGPRKVSLRVVLTGRQKPVDRDAYDKVLLDALKRAGLITDDSARGLLGRVEVEFERGVEGGTEITLTDVLAAVLSR